MPSEHMFTLTDFKFDFDTQTKVKNKNRFQWLNMINLGLSELGIFIMFSQQNLFLFFTFVYVWKSDLKFLLLSRYSITMDSKKSLHFFLQL
jgi:hypothetical protein